GGDPAHPRPASRAGAPGCRALLLRAHDAVRDRTRARDLRIARLAGAQPRDVTHAPPPPEGTGRRGLRPMKAAGRPGRAPRPHRAGAAEIRDLPRRRQDPEQAPAPAERRRASRSLWAACEAFLSPGEPALVHQALDRLAEAFGADGVALHALAPSGAIEPLS